MNLAATVRKHWRKGMLAGATILAACGGGGSTDEGDSTPPSIQLQPASGTFTTDMPYSCSASDNESAVKNLKLTINSANAPVSGTLSTNGTYQLNCSASSEGGSASGSATVTINKTVPQGPSITSFTAQDSTLLEGDTLKAQLRFQGDNGSILNSIASGANGTTSPLDYVYKAGAQNFTLTGRASKSGFADVNQSLPITMTPLSASVAADKPVIQLGQQVDLALNAPLGTDSVVVTENGSRINSVTGNTGHVLRTPASAGTKTYVATAWNAGVSKASTPTSVDVTSPPPMVNLHFSVQEVKGVNVGRINIYKNGQVLSIPQDTIVQFPAGANTLRIDPGQANIHDVINYQFTSLPGMPLKNIPLHQNQTSYTVDLGTQDQNVVLKVVSKTHPELQGASYASFRRIWPDIVPPLDDVQKINIWKNSSIGGGLNGCDQFDLDPQQLAAAHVAADSIVKYVAPVWGSSNVTVQETTVAPQNVFGQQVYCPGFVGPGLNFVGDQLRASYPRSRDNTAFGGEAFQEMKDYWWGNRGREDTQDAGFSMSDQNASGAKAWPQPLDIFVMNYLIQDFARDAEKLRAYTGGATGHTAL